MAAALFFLGVLLYVLVGVFTSAIIRRNILWYRRYDGEPIKKDPSYADVRKQDWGFIWPLYIFFWLPGKWIFSTVSGKDPRWVRNYRKQGDLKDEITTQQKKNLRY